ncbi:MAG: hypothetical protein A4E28_02755 [Methanocella sp. PtaU1.Bin125]|nr:MAG: hypothetical protein A4E28_02755 [Methanocella sp. PtaU1.Bin125]
MDAKILKLTVFCAFIVVAVIVAGCIFSSINDVAESTPEPCPSPSTSPGQTVPPSQSGGSPTPVPGVYIPGTIGGGNSVYIPVPTQAPGTGPSQGTPTPMPTPTPVPAVTPVPVISATTSDWGSDKDVYPRGSTATGWVYVTNTGNVPIDRVDFIILIQRTIFFVPVSKTFTYNATGLNIQPGSKQQVAFSLSIPADYEGISTAGDYRLTATAYLGGNQIGSYSKNLKIV